MTLHRSTAIIRSTLTPARAGEPLHAGPVFAAPFHTPGDPAGTFYSYGRSANPTWTALEEAIAGIEGARCAGVRVFGSGAAATAASLGSVLRPGDRVVLPEGVYFGTRAVLNECFGPMGIEVVSAAMERGLPTAVLEGASLVWVETPSNPQLRVTDLRMLAEQTHAAGALLVADNTTATPVCQQVLELGADLAVVSDSKLMTGHSDLLLGHVAAADPALLESIDRWRTLTGGVPGPMEAWLALRSLATLPLRAERTSANAQAIAELLAAREEVEAVFYPGLASDPGHLVAAQQMEGFGPVVSFVLRDQATAERFFAAARLVTEATSFGGVTTTAERRRRWGHDAVPEGLIRLSAGCEDVRDLCADLIQALEAAVR